LARGCRAHPRKKSPLQRADAALYAAKRAGRNRFESFLETCTV
jgi:PleD family two-component response regulator